MHSSFSGNSKIIMYQSRILSRTKINLQGHKWKTTNRNWTIKLWIEGSAWREKLILKWWKLSRRSHRYNIICLKTMRQKRMNCSISWMLFSQKQCCILKNGVRVEKNWIIMISLQNWMIWTKQVMILTFMTNCRLSWKLNSRTNRLHTWR